MQVSSAIKFFSGFHNSVANIRSELDSEILKLLDS
jgi:hypothetical protein